MTSTLIYPSNASLTEVAQVLTPTMTMDDILFDIMPIENVEADILMWEQMDDFIGLQQIRGINGQPSRVVAVGAKTYMVTPGVYGEYAAIDEKQITGRRQYGTFAQPISIADLVAEKQRQLLSRRIDRIRYIGWTLLQTGTFSVAHPNGAVVHTDIFSLATYNASTWGTVSTATPLADFRALQQTGPAQGTDYNGNSYAICNRKTANYLLSNTNAADIGGKRTSGLANILSMAEVNSLFLGEDLPQLKVYDKGYKNASGTFTRFLADNIVVCVGQRPANAPVAKYLMTRNANNPGFAPGAYMKVVANEDEVPYEVKVHDGHNGGPVIYYPGSITIMDVS